MGVLLSELRNARAFPRNPAAIEGGLRRSAEVFCTADTAAPIVLLDARLKLSVTEGKWPQ
jgi:hypothetical protein